MGIPKLIPSAEAIFPGVRVEPPNASSSRTTSIFATATHLYIDGNYLLHTASRSSGKKKRKEEAAVAVGAAGGGHVLVEEVEQQDLVEENAGSLSAPWRDPAFDDPYQKAEEIEAFLRKVISALNGLVKPYLEAADRKDFLTIYLLFDGPGSRAKLLVSRDRRRKDESSFWRQALTPGTEVMQKLLRDRIEGHFCHKFVKRSGDVVTRIHFSDSDVPGEGEHKIIEAIHEEEYNCKAARSSSLCHVVAGGDSDLLLCCLNTTSASEGAALSTPPSQLYLHFADGGGGGGGNGASKGGKQGGKSNVQSHPHVVDIRALQRALLLSTSSKSAGGAGGAAAAVPGIKMHAVKVVRPACEVELTLRRDFTFLCMLQGNDYVPGVSAYGTLKSRWKRYVEILKRKQYQSSPVENWGIIRVIDVSARQLRKRPKDHLHVGAVSSSTSRSSSSWFSGKWFYYYHQFCSGICAVGRGSSASPERETHRTTTLEEILVDDEEGEQGREDEAAEQQGTTNATAIMGNKKAGKKGKGKGNKRRGARGGAIASSDTEDPAAAAASGSEADVVPSASEVSSSSSTHARSREYLRAMLWTLDCYSHGYPFSYSFGFQDAPVDAGASSGMLTGRMLVRYIRESADEFENLIGPGVAAHVKVNKVKGKNSKQEMKDEVGEARGSFNDREDHDGQDQEQHDPILPLTRCLSVVPVHRLQGVVEAALWAKVKPLFLPSSTGFLFDLRVKERELLARMAQTKVLSGSENEAQKALLEKLTSPESGCASSAAEDNVCTRPETCARILREKEVDSAKSLRQLYNGDSRGDSTNLKHKNIGFKMCDELQRLHDDYETKMVEKEKFVKKVSRWRREEFRDIDKLDLVALDQKVRLLIGEKAVTKQEKFHPQVYGAAW